MKQITLTLPWPPSVNHYWRNLTIAGQPRVLISAKGRAYRQDVAAAVLSQGWPKFHEDRVEVEIIAHPPDRRARDLDNLLKSVLDALGAAGVYTSDSQIDDLRIRRGVLDPPKGYLAVTIQSVEPAGMFPEGGK